MFLRKCAILITQARDYELTGKRILSADLSTIRSSQTASLLAASLLLLIAFPTWMHYRERIGKPALIPNTIWKNIPFSSTCVMVSLSYGVMNANEIFSSL